MNKIQEIDVEDLVNELNDFLVKITIKANEFERQCIDKFNKPNYNYIIEGLMDFSRLIAQEDSKTIMEIERHFESPFTLHHKMLMIFFTNIAIHFIRKGYEYKQMEDKNDQLDKQNPTIPSIGT
jgi:hypothetical protein